MHCEHFFFNKHTPFLTMFFFTKVQVLKNKNKGEPKKSMDYVANLYL